jgi:DnaJ-class molecular chaperone
VKKCAACDGKGYAVDEIVGDERYSTVPMICWINVCAKCKGTGSAPDQRGGADHHVEPVGK